MSRIVLFGEFSGLFANLAYGLRQLGRECITISGGDGFKAITSDVHLPDLQGSAWRRVLANRRRWLELAAQMEPGDILNVITPHIVPVLAWGLLAALRRRRIKLIFWAAGDDWYYYRQGPKYRQWTYSGVPLRAGAGRPTLKLAVKTAMPLAWAQHIIPVSYDYAEAYRNSPFRWKLCRTLPLPCPDSWVALRNPKRGRLVVYHGVTRPEFKGSEQIERAFRICDSQLSPGNAEFVLGRPVPFSEYVRLLERVDILVDQCKGYSYGINALLGLAKGCAVMAPAAPECRQEFGVHDIPIMAIEPNAGLIAQKLLLLIRDDALRVAQQAAGYCYLAQVHDARAIARGYLERVGEDQVPSCVE